MAASAGVEYTQVEPRIWFSPDTGTQKLPAIDLPYHADFPTGWIEIPYTANGVQWTFVNPKQDIPTDEVGIWRQIAAGTDTINVTYQARSPTLELISTICGMYRETNAAASEVVKLVISSGCSGSQTAVVTLNGVAGPNISLASTDATPDAVATKIAAGAYPGWTAAQGTGAETNVVRFTATAPGVKKLSHSYTPGGAGGAGAISVQAVGTIAHERMTLDPTVDNSFLLAIDGHFAPGSLTAAGGQIRMIAYNVNQTDNPQVHTRTLGNDALMQPTTTARCLGSTISPSQIQGCGYPSVDRRGRIDWWNV